MTIFSEDTDKDYLRGRLCETVVRHKGEPAFIYNITDNRHVVFSYLGEEIENKKTASFKSRYFDFSSPPLGYMNLQGRAYYVMRIPRRRWKQGIDRYSLTTVFPSSEKGLGSRFPEGHLRSLEFKKCIKGEFPSMEEALKQVENSRGDSVAFSRGVAIRKSPKGNIVLDYKGREIGWQAGTDTFSLNRKYGGMLKETLRGEGVKVL